MPRPALHRKVVNPPKMSGFKPFGMNHTLTGSVKMHFDEYESINLINYKGLSQDEASVIMGVSRPTFTRVYNKALKKIAKAFIECLSIEIEGGNVEFGKQWYKCQKCFKLIEGIENHVRCKGCNSYDFNELKALNEMK
jgi:predicted DNA-binding protein (UPF0251 family)